MTRSPIATSRCYTSTSDASVNASVLCHRRHFSACLDPADTGPTESVTGQGNGLADGPVDSDSETNPAAADLGLADIDPADTVTGLNIDPTDT